LRTKPNFHGFCALVHVKMDALAHVIASGEQSFDRWLGLILIAFTHFYRNLTFALVFSFAIFLLSFTLLWVVILLMVVMIVDPNGIVSPSSATLHHHAIAPSLNDSRGNALVPNNQNKNHTNCVVVNV
jgi:hypothetical protein